MRRKYLVLLVLLPLVACATPRQQCINDATRDLQVLDRLIIETRQNLDRGFAIEQEVVPRVGFTYCFGNSWSNAGVSFCSNNSTQVRNRPVAIDTEAERRKLAELETRRVEVAARSQRALAACEAQFGV
jgi:hypothetical protein